MLARKGVEIVGYGANNPANTSGPKAHIIAGASSNTNLPAIWMSGSFGPVFRNLQISFPAVDVKLGVDSNGNANLSPSGNPTWAAQFIGDSFSLNQASGRGPNVILGTNNFNDYFRDCAFNVNAIEESSIITSCVNSAGTTTCLLAGSAPASWTTAGTENLSITGSSNPSFEGVWVGATIIDATHFSFSQTLVTGASGTGESGCQLDQGVAILANPLWWKAGIGSLFVQDSFFAGAGNRIYGSPSGLLSSTTIRGGYTSENLISPILDAVGCSAGVSVENIFNADSPNIPMLRTSALQHSCIGGTAVNSLGGAATVEGPAQLGPQTQPTTRYPSVMGQTGIQGKRLFAQDDVSRRNFGAVATRYTNLETFLPGSWPTTGGCGTPTGTTTADPQGGTSAGTYSGSSAPACFYHASITVASGDQMVGGAWVRSRSANGYGGAIPVQITGPTFASSPQTTGSPTAAQSHTWIGGAGGWQWYTAVGTVATAATVTTNFQSLSF